MSMTPKQKWIFNFMRVLCRKCGRCERIHDRLQKDISDNDFDCDKDKKAEQIILEEA